MPGPAPAGDRTMPEGAAAVAYTVSVWALPVLTAITLHEAAHGYAAERFGDDTARQAGRVSLNPLRHVDPVGTVLLPLLLLLVSPLVFGYAKPVPVRFSRLCPRRVGIAVVALAGPAMNLALALLAALLLHLIPGIPAGGRWVADNLVNALWINVLLALLNLLPLLPLDGGRVLYAALPSGWARRWAATERYGFPALLAGLVGLPLAASALGAELPVFRWLLGDPARYVVSIIVRMVGLS